MVGGGRGSSFRSAEEDSDGVGADAAGGAVFRAAALDADVARADDFDRGSEGETAFLEVALEDVSSGGLLEAGDEVHEGLAVLERLPAGQPPHPVFRDLHARGKASG
jgi:hypothetical protein